MSITDQDQREAINKSYIDKKNTSRMIEIVSQIGWPNKTKVGEQAAHLAWLLVQHADHNIHFQEKCLILMKKEQLGEVSKIDIAYLEDRVRVNKNKRQLYGTQFYKDPHGFRIPLPIENITSVNQRRHDIGLWPVIYFSTKVLTQLRDDLENTHLLVCGEIHGVKENYLVYQELINQLSINKVGIELDDSIFHFLLKPTLHKDSTRALRELQWPDGRVNTSFIEFLEYTKDEKIPAFFFDNITFGQVEKNPINKDLRDQVMSQEVIKYG